MWKVPLTRPTTGREETEAVERVLESGMLTQGEETRLFEQEFARYLGVKHAVATSSCTTALHLALRCLDVGCDDVAVVPDYTFPATGNVVYHCGAIPVLCDIRLNEFQINPDLVEPLITSNTKVLMPVSEFGLTADMKPLIELAEKHNLFVVEDAAPAIGSMRDGYRAGALGDIGCFSFHPRKLIAVGEGGMLVTNHEDLAEKVRMLRDHGQSSKWRFEEVGYNYRMSDVHSAIGRVQLRKLPGAIKRRRELAKVYNEVFDGGPYVPDGCFHTYQSYVLLFDEPTAPVIARLRERGIEAQIGTSCLHLTPVYMNGSYCPNSEYAWRHAITLPLYESMTVEEQQLVIDEVATARNH